MGGGRDVVVPSVHTHRIPLDESLFGDGQVGHCIMGGINGESVDNNNSQPTLQGNERSHPPHWSSMNWAVNGDGGGL